MKLDINNYTGAKRNSGLDKWIINMIPDCKTFIEAFAGSGHISMKLVEAGANCKIKVQEKSLEVAKQLYAKFNTTAVVVERIDSLVFFEIRAKPTDNRLLDTVVYFDPPYLKETRYSNRYYYEHDWDMADHNRFIHCLICMASFGVKVIVSHPKCKIYHELLKYGFECVEFKTSNRGGATIEYVYRNFDPAEHKLLVSDYVGYNRTQRQILKRRGESFVRKLKTASLHERQYLMDFIHKNL